MQRYFIDNINNSTIDIASGKITISGDDYYHISKVMRMKTSDQVTVCFQQVAYLAEINKIDQTSVYLDIVKPLDENPELSLEVTIAQGIVRREKMEEVIDRISELGAKQYLGVNMERCNVKLTDDKLDRKRDRLNKIAKEACEQAHRTKLLTVDVPLCWKEFLKISANYDLCLVAYEECTKDDNLRQYLQNDYRNVLILVGPEGGISPKEMADLTNHNFKKVTLGPRILRTEVAPVYIMSAISYERGE